MTTLPSLAVRNVAEYAYCPRLYYYMQVEGTFLASSDTEQGALLHRRVDRASTLHTDDPASAEASKILYAVTLHSEKLALTAVLDVLEIHQQQAIPVEYRKGRPRPESEETPDPQHRIWPTDRIQGALQGILLTESGYQVPRLEFYYATTKQRLALPFDQRLEQEALATLAAARQAASSDRRPPPLLNDPRCLRCSLQPICLPDEINHQRQLLASQDMGKRIWPPRDDGDHLVVQKQGVNIGIAGHSLQVREAGRLCRTIPLANVESLAVLGSVQLSTQALTALASKKIPVAFLSAAGRLLTIMDPLDSVSAALRRAQVRRLDQETACLEMAKALVAAKIKNQRTLLMRNHKNLPKTVAEELLQQLRQSHRAANLDSLRGHEGQAAALYFGHFDGMIKSPLAADFKAHGRRRRPPPDAVNACLSLAYTMLVHEAVSALRLARLEPAIGGYHRSRAARPALALDLIEPFRPLIADSLVLSALNGRQLLARHFQQTAAGCQLTREGRSQFFRALGRRMEAEVRHPIFGYRLSYRRMLHIHARMLAAWLIGDIPSLHFLTTR